MRVALIDSGINAGHEHVGAVRAGARIVTTPSGPAAIEGIDAAVDAIGHGTACAGLVRWLAPDAELIAIRVFDSTLRAPCGYLPPAFAFAMKEGARLANLSLGLHSEEVLPEADQALDALLDTGVTVVAALGPRAAPTWPASHPGVVAVTADPHLESDRWIWIDEGFRGPDGAAHPLVAAAPFPRPMPGRPREQNLAGVSFAAAAISGLLARLDLPSTAVSAGLREGAEERFTTRAAWLSARGAR